MIRLTANYRPVFRNLERTAFLRTYPSEHVGDKVVYFTGEGVFRRVVAVYEVVK